MEFKDLLIQKKSRKKPMIGDMFIINPREGLYCFGKVIDTDVDSKDVFVKGMNLIYIYDFFTCSREIPENIDLYDLMIPPMVVNNQLWLKGYAETIDNRPVSKKDKEIDFGFLRVGTNEYVDIKKNRISCKPQYVGIFGLCSYGAVGKEVQKAIKEKGL